MPQHAQQTILTAVQAALAGAGTAAGSRVFLDRLDALTEAELPAILVDEAPEGETVDATTIGALEQRVYSVRVACIVAHDDSHYAAAARDLGRQVEEVLAAPSLSIVGRGRCRLRASRMVSSGESEIALAAREQTWQVSYFVRRDAPSLPQ